MPIWSPPSLWSSVASLLSSLYWQPECRWCPRERHWGITPLAALFLDLIFFAPHPPVWGSPGFCVFDCCFVVVLCMLHFSHFVIVFLFLFGVVVGVPHVFVVFLLFNFCQCHLVSSLFFGILVCLMFLFNIIGWFIHFFLNKLKILCQITCT